MRYEFVASPSTCVVKVTDKFGTEEANEMHEDGKLIERANPHNPKRTQYAIREDTESRSVQKQDDLKTACCYCCFVVVSCCCCVLVLLLS